MPAQILFRVGDEWEEYRICTNIFGSNCVQQRTELGPIPLTIGRYSVLPMYRELELDCWNRYTHLIHTTEQHEYIADIRNWAVFGALLDGLTPKTWETWGQLPEGSYVLKGVTNSRKHNWDTHMFAPTKADIPRIARNLLQDSLIGPQGIVIREYIPLRKLGIGINGLPITNEWRTFWYSAGPGTSPIQLVKGFYWGSHPELASETEFDGNAENLALHAATLLGSKGLKFFVLDLGQKEDGTWTIIEVNEGQMSGLGLCSATTLYQTLWEVTK